jgi:cold shock protein
MTMTGRIIKHKPVEGFGFIKGDDNVDRFFHKTAVVEGDFDHMKVDDRVTFEHEDAPKGPRAANVREALPVRA